MYTSNVINIIFGYISIYFTWNKYFNVLSVYVTYSYFKEIDKHLAFFHFEKLTTQI